ncbi:MAG TPA: isocitrate/isopropylmalate dehydrogenase family protein [Aggregatilineales bacterium]|nr:isocitrate/isopropylmalate dehydrogenase family protein [Aggregatilineales bacterium]
MHTITLIKGDGIGAEVIPCAENVLVAMNLPLTLRYAEAGFGTFEKMGDALPKETIQACETSDAVLFGATQSPMGKVEGYISPILSLRRRFNLYANLRPALKGDIDMLVVRENTEGMYSGRERVEADGQIAILERVITAGASERITKVACEQAMTRRRKVTIVHKANVLKETCGLFRRVAFEVTAQYPDLQVEELLVDAAAMHMAQTPTRFDVIVTTNLFGDILSDLAAGLTGGLGIAPSANIGRGEFAVFEPVHGSAPDIVGQGIADPRATLLSVVMMLDYLGYTDDATRLRRVVYATPHTGNTQGTTEAIITKLAV